MASACGKRPAQSKSTTTGKRDRNTGMLPIPERCYSLCSDVLLDSILEAGPNDPWRRIRSLRGRVARVSRKPHG